MEFLAVWFMSSLLFRRFGEEFTLGRLLALLPLGPFALVARLASSRPGPKSKRGAPADPSEIPEQPEPRRRRGSRARREI